MKSLLPADYAPWLAQIKARVQAARTRSVLAVQREQIDLYLEIGRSILERQGIQGWGAAIIERLSADLHREFPDAKGFSVANLRHMRKAAEIFLADKNLSQVVRELPWGHCLSLIYQIKTNVDRIWYAKAAIQHGWSRAILDAQIHKPVGIAEYRLTEAIPDNLRGSLPSIEELEAALRKVKDESDE